MGKKVTFKEFGERVKNLNLIGRDEFHTQLIFQEYLMWFSLVAKGDLIQDEEVDFISTRRGFNDDEKKNLIRLAQFLNTNQETIIRLNNKNEK